MYDLRFDEETCRTCPTVDCLVKCQYLNMDKDEARKEMMDLIEGGDPRVLKDCVTCYACEEYCKRGNHPFYLITERRDRKGILTAPRAITRQWKNIGEPQGKYQVGEVRDRILSFGFTPELMQMAQGKLFEDLMPAFIFGQEFFCNVVYIHFADTSLVKDRLPAAIESISRVGAKEVVCLHDECYGAFTSLAPAYGMEVPFQPIHYFDYLYDRLKDLEDLIRPLNVKVAYQRPCSSRLCPDKHRRFKEIMDLIGADLVEREYQDENALCCGGIFAMCFGYDLAHDVQTRNISDMLAHGARYCVFNCPACQNTLTEKLQKRGVAPIHLIDLCRAAIGELGLTEVEPHE